MSEPSQDDLWILNDVVYLRRRSFDIRKLIAFDVLVSIIIQCLDLASDLDSQSLFS